MKIVMTLLVRDEADVLVANIEHHLAAGVSHIVCTDNGSIDGARQLLGLYEELGYLTLIDVPPGGYEQSAWVTRMARLAATDHAADWVLNVDVDEFIWPVDPSGSLPVGPEIDIRPGFAAIEPEFGSVTIRRDNLLITPGTSGTWPHRLLTRDTESLSERGTRIGSKSAHRADPAVEVSFGNHSTTIGRPSPAEPFVLLHVPSRSYEQYRRKIDNGGKTLEANKDLSPDVGWHWRIDYERLKNGELESTWDGRLLTAEQLAAGTDRGALLPETRLLQRLEFLRGNTVMPGILDPLLEEPTPVRSRLGRLFRR